MCRLFRKKLFPSRLFVKKKLLLLSVTYFTIIKDHRLMMEGATLVKEVQERASVCRLENVAVHPILYPKSSGDDGGLQGGTPPPLTTLNRGSYGPPPSQGDLK